MSIAQIISYGVFGLATGLGIGGLKLMDRKLNENSGRDRELRLLEDYDGELPHMVLEVGLMKDKYGKAFYELFHALKQLIVLDRFLPQMKRSLTWTQTASSYFYDLDCAVQYLADRVYDFPDKAQVLGQHLKAIREVGEKLNKNVALLNDDLMQARS